MGFLFSDPLCLTASPLKRRKLTSKPNNFYNPVNKENS
jgi:hypothetical protein